ncbi:MAG: head-tail adaptor protein [Ruminococcus sp.]|nr:head-tail adaptor protein [Ruminococcus sp.]
MRIRPCHVQSFSEQSHGYVTTWYRPDITAGCRVRCIDGTLYEVINKPENIEQQNRVLQFKVRRVEGGA